MSADDLSVRITARDQLSGKIKDAQAQMRRLVGEATELNKAIDTPEGRRAWDRHATAIQETSQELKRLRAEMGRNEKAIRDVGTEGQKSAAKVEGAQTKVRSSFLKSRGAAVAFGAGATLALTRVWDTAKKIATGFSDVGSETMKLKRVMGGTAEEASGMAAAFRLSGVDTTKGAKAVTLFSKTLTTADSQIGEYQDKVDAAQASNKKLTARLGQQAAVFGSLGIAVKDSGGKVRSTTDILLDTADVFAKMPDGAAKTAYAMKLFGKSGTDMLPFLNRGKAGVQALLDQSEKLGTTLSGPDLDALKANNQAKRDWGEALKGLQVILGRELYPTMTRWTKYLGTSVVPSVKMAARFFGQHRDVIVALGLAIGVTFAAVKAGQFAMSAAAVAVKAWTVATKIASAATKVWAGLQWAWNAAMAANPVGLVVIGIAALVAAVVLAYKKVGWFRAGVDAAWAWIRQVVGKFVDWFRGTAWPAVKTVFGWWLTYAKFMVGVYVKVWNAIKGAVAGFVSWFRGTAWPILKTVGGWIIGYYRTLWTVASTVWGKIVGAVKGAVDRIREIVKRLKDAFSGIFDGIVGKAKAAVDGIAGVFSKAKDALSFLPGFWHGGPVEAGTRAWVGELGPELFVPRAGAPRVIGEGGPEVMDFAQGGFIIPNHLMPAAAVVASSSERVVERERGPLVQFGDIHAGGGAGADPKATAREVRREVLRADRIRRERR